MSRVAEDTDALLIELLSPSGSVNQIALYDAMRYSVAAGGKRIRPFLTTEFCALFGGGDQKALWYAAGIEMLHTMSLIHDDLPAMDNDVLRRGKPTNHVIFGEATAILAGDALLSEAFRTTANNPWCSPGQNLEAVRVLAEYGGAEGMMGGQQIDLQSEKIVISRDVLEDLVSKKTAALLSCSCLLGCIAANADDTDRNKAITYGYKLGMAFQIADDILDCEGDSDTLGKSTGKDEKSGKSTFVSVLGKENAKQLAKTLTEEAKDSISDSGDRQVRKRLLEFCDLMLFRKF